MFYIYIKFHENILDCIKVIQQTRFFRKQNSMRHNSTKLVGGVTILSLCTLTDSGLKFHENIIDGFEDRIFI